jgi:release factor glutamine methyltransferase
MALLDMTEVDVPTLPLRTPVPEADRALFCSPAAALRPSEYTAALIQVLRARAAWIRGADVLEIGCGSGVVLAAAGAFGAASLCGIDIESEAVISSALLLRQLGHGDNVTVHHGDMWLPVAGHRFDLIVANLPHFPMQPHEFAGRRPSWSSGGPTGRGLLDRFLEELGCHLAPSGRAVITHNGFVELARSRAMVEASGLSLRIAATVLVHIAPEKLKLMTQSVLDNEEGRSIHRYGPYAFGEMHIIEIGSAPSLG